MSHTNPMHLISKIGEAAKRRAIHWPDAETYRQHEERIKAHAHRVASDEALLSVHGISPYADGSGVALDRLRAKQEKKRKDRP